MSLLEKVNSDLKLSMKARDEIRTNTLRRIKTAVMNAEIKKGGPLSEEETLEAVFSMTKAQADSIESFKKGGRTDLVAKEEQELSILMTYLPKQLGEDELKQIVGEAIAASGAQSARDIGKVMGLVMPKVKGKADGSAINAMARQLLEKTQQ